MEYCICKNNLKRSFSCHQRSLIFKFFSSGPTMIGPIVDSEYKGVSSTHSVNFAYKTLVMAILSSNILQKPIQLSENFNFEHVFSGPNHGGHYNRYWRMPIILKVFDSHAYPPVPTACKYPKKIALRRLSE